MRIGRRHDLIGIVADNPVPEFTVVGRSWCDRRRSSFQAVRAFRSVRLIEPEFCLAFVRVGAVTGIASIREDRSNIAAKRNVVGQANRGQAKDRQGTEYKRS